MALRPEEISSVIEKELTGYEHELAMERVGNVLSVGDSIARIYGLSEAMMAELLEFPGGIMGMVLNLEEHSVGAAIFGSDREIKEGDTVRALGRVASIPAGPALLGRVVDPLGKPLDGEGPIAAKEFRPIESKVPNVISRQPVKEPLMTGLKAIDSMIPIGRGQRELIIGDRQTGKTAIAVDAIINQKDTDVHCIYVAIGQKLSSIAALVETLKRHGAMDYTTIICASAEEAASMLYIAPYSGAALGEYYRDNGQHALCIYDDLSKHAAAYRQLALLLRRPPGREAFPGDVFYLHSRLLERAAKLSEKFGGGSLTALPIIETQAGDISAYIPTNVISITDGQIYLEPDLFYGGIRPAINVGLSVSRVGGNAQTPAMKGVGGRLRLDMAQYRELAAFAQFGSDLDKATQAQLRRGEVLTEVLKQDQYQPLSLADQVIIIYAGTNGYLDDLPVEAVARFEQELKKFIDEKYHDLAHQIETDKKLTDELSGQLKNAITEFKGSFEVKEEEKDGI